MPLGFLRSESKGRAKVGETQILHFKGWGKWQPSYRQVISWSPSKSQFSLLLSFGSPLQMPATTGFEGLKPGIITSIQIQFKAFWSESMHWGNSTKCLKHRWSMFLSQWIQISCYQIVIILIFLCVLIRISVFTLLFLSFHLFEGASCLEPNPSSPHEWEGSNYFSNQPVSPKVGISRHIRWKIETGLKLRRGMQMSPALP